MDINKYVEAVEALSRILKENNLKEITLEAESVKLKLTGNAHVNMEISDGAGYQPRTSQSLPVTSEVTPKTEEKNLPSGNIVKSPIIGTFYSAPSPESEPFVTVGSRIEKGQVICIIESMKLMNEVLSDFSGTVKEIYLNNGAAVEFDQKIMLIE